VASYSTLSSEDLVKACVGSDNYAAWAEFVRRFQPTIAKIVLRRARHWEQPPRQLIDDLVQETYLKLCANNCAVLASFEPRGKDSVKSFLAVIAARVVHDHYKSERARKRDVHQTDALPEEEAREPRAIGQGSAPSMEMKVLHREIDEALIKYCRGEQAARNRAIFWLHYGNGMTASAIASMPSMNLTVKGVETLLRRMLDVIRGHMGDP